jgi:formamidopyrimidine-DNA glycosylase
MTDTDIRRNVQAVPELPEVEAFVRAQHERLVGYVVDSVPVKHFATVKTIDPPVGALVGREVTGLRRRAKRLLLDVDEGLTVVIHPMGGGKLSMLDKHPKSSVFALAFDSGLELSLSEPGSKRRAAVWIVDAAGLEQLFEGTGPEPLDPSFTVDVLRGRLEARPGQLHAWLRDQRAVAGIGRAFANEILWTAQLSPFARTATLSDADVVRLHEAITGVLSDAVERLVPLSKDGLASHSKRGHAVHDKLGQPCPRCGDEIRRVSFEEHTVYYCARCQTGGRVLADRRLSRLLRD